MFSGRPNNKNKYELLLLVEEEWQKIADLIVSLLKVNIAMITKRDNDNLVIISTNNSNNNPFKKNDRYKMAGHYCEKVLKEKRLIEISNYKNKNNLEFPQSQKYNLKSYLGVPILKPDGKTFGTFCVFDNKERNFKEEEKDLMKEFKTIIEYKLENIYLNSILNERIKDYEQIKHDSQMILDSINDPIFFHEYYPQSKENKLGPFIDVNEATCKKLGYTKDELLKLSPEELDVITSETIEKRKENIKKLEEKKEHIFETIHKTKNGKKVPVEINSKIVNLDKKKMVLSVSRDISKRKKYEKNLIKEKELSQSLINSLSANIAVLDRKGFIKYVNNAWENFAVNNGLKEEESGVGTNYLEVCKNSEGEWSKEAGIVYDGIKRVIKGKADTFSIEYPCHSPYKKRWFKMRITPFVGEGEYSAVIAHENITEKRIKDEKLQEQKDKLDKILETTGDGFFIINEKGEFIRVNKSFIDMVDYNEKELLHMKISDIDIKETKKGLQARLQKIIEKKKELFETKYKKKNGKVIDVEVNKTYINEKASPIFYAFVRNITQRKKEKDKIKYLSIQDQLTGLYNRAYFADTVKRINKSRKLPIGVITADIDNLKSVNDMYGHSIGDKYIKRVADVLRNVVRESDIICRIGGDEFSIILPEIKYDNLKKIKNRIAINIKKIDIKDIDFSISIGIAIKKSYKQDLNEIIKISDEKMYEMKKQNKKEYFKRKLSIVRNKKRIVFNEMPIAIIISDFKGNIIEVNYKFCELLGYTEKELKTMTHFDITKKEDNQKNKEYMDKITNKELDNFELNKKYIKKNGEYIDVNIKVRVIKDNYGEPVYDFAFVKKR